MKINTFLNFIIISFFACSGGTKNLISYSVPLFGTIDAYKGAIIFDTDGDGKVDRIEFYQEQENKQINTSKVITWRWLDTNNDGRPDIIIKKLPKGRIEFIDSAYDGKIDVSNCYNENHLAWQIMDRDYIDGRPDIWKEFDINGNIIRILRDTNANGCIDTEEILENNEVKRIIHLSECQIIPPSCG